MTDHNARQAGITEALHYLQMGIANLELGNGMHMIDFRNAERAILAAHSADARNGQGVAQGWKLVPVEPTDEMAVAFAEAWFSKVRPIDDCMMNDAYAAMLDAAPAAPAPHANCPAPVDATEAAEREHLGCAHCNTGIYAAPAPAAQVDELPLAREVRATLNLIANSFHNCKGSAATMQELARDCLQRFDAARQQSATPAECTCPSGNGSLRHPCPAHPADAASDPLRAVVQAAVDLMEAREWAEHFAECHAPGDELASRLEACITSLHNEAYGGEDRADPANEADDHDEFARAVAEMEDCGESSAPYSKFMQWVARGLLECSRFELTQAGRDFIQRERQQGASDA